MYCAPGRVVDLRENPDPGGYPPGAERIGGGAEEPFISGRGTQDPGPKGPAIARQMHSLKLDRSPGRLNSKFQRSGMEIVSEPAMSIVLRNTDHGENIHAFAEQ